MWGEGIQLAKCIDIIYLGIHYYAGTKLAINIEWSSIFIRITKWIHSAHAIALGRYDERDCVLCLCYSECKNLKCGLCVGIALSTLSVFCPNKKWFCVIVYLKISISNQRS